MPNQPRLIKEESTPYAIDEAQKEEYRQRLREKLRDPEFRQIEGFPIGEDEAILNLSDPPYYTACPNPFLPEIIEQWQAERAELRRELGLVDDTIGAEAGTPQQSSLFSYRREPFASDVSEGKNNPIYNAHTYHTKVPHKAIMRYILHYTDPGDIVFDGFCGTGMTGVAAQLCADRKEVESLGYRVDADGVVYEGNKPISHLGMRKALLNDLSPAATFIAYNYNMPVDVQQFERVAKRILDEVEEELGWMYETWHPHCDDPNRVKAKVNFTVWSDVSICTECGSEMRFWDIAVDKKTGYRKGRDESLECPICGALAPLRMLERAWNTSFDHVLNRAIKNLKRVPVLVNYSIGKQKYEKSPDGADLALIARVEKSNTVASFPDLRMPEGDESRRNDSIGITHVHHFYTTRSLIMWANLMQKVHSSPAALRRRLLFWLQTVGLGQTLLNRYLSASFSQVNRYLKGTLYIGPFISEVSPWYALTGKLRSAKNLNFGLSKAIITNTGSATSVPAEDSSFDYIFTDPPFGANINYSDLNFIWEAWLNVVTNNHPEAIVSNTHRKTLVDYQGLMHACFREYYRVLKAGRWMTVEFHNSKNSVWNAIQEALMRAGFIIADIRTLDKKQMTMQQMTSTSAVKQDLIISTYKPNKDFEQRFMEESGSKEGAWNFVRQHLSQLPVVVEKDGIIETLSERQDYLLFDRMVAFHIQRGATVPLSAAEFYAGLRSRFVERDGMFFLPDQVPQYDKTRLQADQVAQLTLFVSDEKSSIQWLRQQLDPALGGTPMTYQEIQPLFLRQLHKARHEVLPELSEVLEENFLQDEEGRYYVPDPNKASDLEKLREKALLREFSHYLNSKKKLRQFRSEAIRAGFANAWREQNYATIIEVGDRLPERALQEDPDLLMYYDNASLRM